MTTLPIHYNNGNVSIINTNDKLNILKINIHSKYVICYDNDISKITFEFNPTKLSLDNIKCCSKKKLETLEDYKFATQCYLISFSKLILKKIPFDLNTFKNYLNCKIQFEDSVINVNINVKKEYKPDEHFEFAMDKYSNIHKNLPNKEWSNYNIEKQLDLEFSGVIKE